MSEAQTPKPQNQLRRISLFDSYGLPWTSHLSMGWILFVFIVTGGLAAIPIGLCLGVWIRAKTQSSFALLVYVLLAGACSAAFLPGSILAPRWTDLVGVSIVLLWFAGALIARRQIARYYEQQEGLKFRLSLAFTLLFGVWYLNYRMRPLFPSGLKSELSV